MQLAVLTPPPNPIESAIAAGLRYVRSEGPGITRKKVGKAFQYFDARGQRVHDQATLDRIARLVIPPAWTNVWICPSSNGHLQAVGFDAKGRKQYRYHPKYREVRDATKFSRMAAFGAVLPRIRERVSRDLSVSGMPKQKVVAAIVRLLDETCARIGNEEYAKANDSYGLTTLHTDHVSVRGDQIRLRFRGKSGKEADLTLRDPKLARVVKKCQDLPGEELFEYQTDTGEFQAIDSADVNEYLREITGEDITAKDFRTWHGTGHMLLELAELGPADSETEAKRKLAAAVKATAAKLGNRPATCRKYYVHPAIIESYTNLTLFEAIKRMRARSERGASTLRAEELVVLQMIEA